MTAPVAAHELDGIEMLGCLPRCALRELAEGATVRRFRAGEAVFHEGDHGDALYVVRSGRVQVLRPTRDEGVVLDQLGPGRAFGELAVLNGAPRLASIVAVEDTEAIELGKPAFDHALDEHPLAARRMLGALARSLTLAKEETSRRNHRLAVTVRERTLDLKDMELEVVQRLSHAAESRDQQTGLHIVRMSRLCVRVADELGLDADEAELLLHAAPMHDVGKIAIPDVILLKPGRLDDAEWAVMRSHAQAGADLLSGSRSPVVQLGEKIALAHHERWDGSGYPHGLAGQEIPLAARIVAVCDVFDALISDRPYKAAWPLADAFAEIARQRGRHFDPRVADAFLASADEVEAIVRCGEQGRYDVAPFGLAPVG